MGDTELFKKLYLASFELIQLVGKIEEDMNDNQEELIENFYEKVQNRQKVIEQMQLEQVKHQVDWSQQDPVKLSQLKEWELQLNRRVYDLYDSFSEQIDKLQQGKRLSKNYGFDYESTIYTDGAYFDKKK